MKPEFDEYSASYEELLRDPLRDRFSGGSGFFHARKRDLLAAFCLRNRIEAKRLRWLDFGCGTGELLRAASPLFASASGCDISSGMLRECEGMEVRQQPSPAEIPFPDGSFNLITAVCVFHHVPPADRLALVREIRRTLAPQGIFAIIEHNPFNPVTQTIVRRTPVDADAQLLSATQCRSLMREAGLRVMDTEYFLYLPQSLYARAPGMEDWFRRIPAGGQYAVYGQLRPTGK